MTQSTNTLKTTEFQAGAGIGTAALTVVRRGTGEPGEVIAFPVPGCGLPIEPTTTQPDNRVGERMLAVLRMNDLTPAQSRVLGVIAYHDGPGGAWPSFKTIAGILALSRSWVSELVGQLEETGRLTRKKTQRTNRYTVHYENPAVRENMTAEIVDNSDKSESCRQGDPTPAVRETLTGTGSKPEVIKPPLILNSDPIEQESLKKEPGRSAQAIFTREAHKKLLASALDAVDPNRSDGSEVRVKDTGALKKRAEKANATPTTTPKLPRQELEALATELRIKYTPDTSDAALTDAIRQGGYSGTTKGGRMMGG